MAHRTLNQPAIQLIVGLGNPGPEYEKTRHNVGAWLVQHLAEQYQATLTPHKKFFGLTAKIQIQNQSIHLLIPSTFMNCSGQAVRAIQQFYQLSATSLLVAHDELDFEAGIVKIKTGGGSGGHRGLKDIISHTGTEQFTRLRIGISHPGHSHLVSNYVLHSPSQTESIQIEDSIQDALRIIPHLVEGNRSLAIQQLHTRN